MTAKEDESSRRANRFSDNTCGHPYDTGRRRGVERAAWWPCDNSYLERVFRANAAVTGRDLAPTRIGRMAKRGAPEPEPDPGPDPDGPTGSSIGPFLGALAVLVVLVLVVFGAQLFSPAGDDLTEDEMVRRAVTDYVSAHNENDGPI